MFPPCPCAGAAGALEIVILLFDNRTYDRLPFNRVYRLAGPKVKKNINRTPSPSHPCFKIPP
jgi:hypothetical protein